MQALIVIQTSASALGSQQRISSFKGSGGGQTETFQGQIEFFFFIILFFYLFIFYIFLFWSDWAHVLAESKSRVKHSFMQIFLGSFHIYGLALSPGRELNNVIYLLLKIWIIRERTGLIFLTHKSWRTEKVISKKSQTGQTDDSSAFLCHVFTNKRFRKITNKCHVGTEARGCLAQT